MSNIISYTAKKYGLSEKMVIAIAYGSEESGVLSAGSETKAKNKAEKILDKEKEAVQPKNLLKSALGVSVFDEIQQHRSENE